MAAGPGADDARRRCRRRSVFRAVAGGMAGLGFVAGLVFPGFVVLLGVPTRLALRPVFVGACLLAGMGVAVGNYALVRLVIGRRLRLLVTGMSALEENFRTPERAAAWDPAEAEASRCRLSAESRDEIGASARAFNRLFDALVASWRSRTAGGSAVESAAGALHTAGRRIDEAAVTAVEASTTASASATQVGRSVKSAAQHAERVVGELVGTSDRARDLVRSAEAAARTVEAVDRTVRAVSATSEQLAGQMGAVEAIARQIRLQALNAKIEAVRATGGQGGFGVIAEGIAALAVRTAGVIAEVGAQVSDNQRQVAEMAGVMDALASFATGVRGDQTEVATRLEDQVRQLREVVAATGTAEQDASRIVVAISAAGDAIRLTSAAVEETRSAVDDLIRTASELSSAG
ncbi:MAG: methyl-accepting chemotaxis protein [Dactylosporangium sp.]|nr:methyl-accepting chemotaxis protein [Dactylosporangium sp.]NNJ62635.1 methyl-accepting chemotaxis protein [Dactylosporangium sp.]